MAVDVWDPLADPDDATQTLGVTLKTPEAGAYETVILAVPHDTLRARGRALIDPLLRDGGVIVDAKGVLPRAADILRI